MKTPENPPLKRVNVNLEAALHDRFKAVAAGNGKKMTDVLIECIRQYIEEASPKSSGKRATVPDR